MLAITTFPEWAWGEYAEDCVRSLSSFWPGSIRVYHEGKAPPALGRVEFRPLNMKARDDFLKLDIDQPAGFLYDAKRFCHKVFAQLDAMDQKFYWIDADMKAFDKIPLELLEEQLEDVPFCYMGRDSYTETGLIGFNPEHKDFPVFKARYTEMYIRVKIFRQTYWTDCHAFDAARRGIEGNNMTPCGQGFENVITQSPFSEYLYHFKGNRKKFSGADSIPMNL